jgi:hypothetical protein
MSIEKALWPYDVRAPLAHAPEADKQRLLAEIGINPAITAMHRHVHAKDVRDVVGQPFFDKLFKFAFVRNPWDLQLSLYHFNLTHPEFPAHAKAIQFRNFEDFILSQRGQVNDIGQQRCFVVDDDGRQIVDFIGHFETLDADFKTVGQHIRLAALALDHVNSTRHKRWQDSYTPAMFEIVRDKYRRDIEAFGYSSDPADYGLTF